MYYIFALYCIELLVTVHCYISVAEKHKTNSRFMTENNKYKQNIELNPITAIEYSSCYK